jgi:hypothetical protein
MRVFYPYWEGSHPAFPKRPEELDRQSSRLFMYAISGVGIGGALAATTALFNRYVPGRTIKWIGLAAVATAVQDRVTEHVLVRRDVLPFLENEGVALPKYRAWKRTSNWTMDDTIMTGAILGIARALIKPRAPFASLSKDVPAFQRQFGSFLRFAGCMTIGGIITAAPEFYAANVPPGPDKLQKFQERTIANVRWRQELAQAKILYETKSGRPAPAWLYGRGIQSTPIAGIPIITPSGEEHPAQGQVHVLSEPNMPEHLLEDMPKGFAPHIAVKVDSDIKFLNARDYYWKAESVQDGLQALEEHIQDLSARRLDLVREAEYLWLEVAKKERGYFKDHSDDDAESRRRLRAKLELLSSIHMNTYTAIAEFDWMIDDTKKMKLQLKSGGDWEPSKQPNIDPKTYVPERILEMLKHHKKQTEENKQQWGSLLTVPIPEDQKGGISDSSRDVEDNDIATAELIEEFEERVKNPGAFDDSDE